MKTYQGKEDIHSYESESVLCTHLNFCWTWEGLFYSLLRYV